ncbi:MAG: carbamoyl-phosphate synthase large subunit [Nitrospinota bacterium]
MPKDKSINKVLIIGAGPIVIGQGCEFDYSGTQATKALKDEGCHVILVNSNPATIMTDPDLADKIYIEPLTVKTVSKIIEKERPDAILPTVGGQTALNIAVGLAESGILEKYSVRLIGANLTAIKKAEDRKLFKDAMTKIGILTPRSALANNMQEARLALKVVNAPAIIRPAFTLGGTGGSIAKDESEFEQKAMAGLAASPTNQLLIEESIAGYKEFELELIRDIKGNVVVICSIENLDPMGVHTGDSITVAPAQTLTDKEYQTMREMAIAIINEIGVETGGSNIQFAVNPSNGEISVIEMNPRVSRSSALASKATGFPIAKIAAKLAIGLTLDEIKNDITDKTLAAFEPAIDYIVTKIPRFTFEKFPNSATILDSQMKSVGEVMGIGRNFRESLQKALRSLETGSVGLDHLDIDDNQLEASLQEPSAARIWLVGEALRRGYSIERLHQLTKIDNWFLTQLALIVHLETKINDESIQDKDFLRLLKKNGFADKQIALIANLDESDIYNLRSKYNIKPVYKKVDTCAGEFDAVTNYLYSTYESTTESIRSDKKKVIILGSGPNRIGQGIEFDYCCVHALLGLKSVGFETIIINCNPETVSTDYDISDKLYFEPLTFEDVMPIIELEEPDGVIVQFGGQTPLNIAQKLKDAGANIIGTPPESIELAEDRQHFKTIVDKLNLQQPANGIAKDQQEAILIADKIGYPVMVRPSFVLGGRAMEVVYSPDQLAQYMKVALQVSDGKPILIDKFLKNATELDVDALSDGKDIIIGGILEHIEEAGVHSGDSASVMPPQNISEDCIKEIKEQTRKLALELKCVGLMNLQFAVVDENLYLLEVNPRGSRTVPFVSKAIGIPLAQSAAIVMATGKLNLDSKVSEQKLDYIAVKESVFPFSKFANVDTILGPEMKSTGEVMGLGKNFGAAFYKATLAAGYTLPSTGTVFISVTDDDKIEALRIAQKLAQIGFKIMATNNTAKFIAKSNLEVVSVLKVKEGSPNAVDMIQAGKVDMVINTTFGAESIKDSYTIRRMALLKNVAYQTTIKGAKAALLAIESKLSSAVDVKPIKDYYINSS